MEFIIPNSAIIQELLCYFSKITKICIGLLLTNQTMLVEEYLQTSMKSLLLKIGLTELYILKTVQDL